MSKEDDKSNNDHNWRKVLEDNPGIEQEVFDRGFCDIQASFLRDNYAQPRLMCKIDFLNTVPMVFKEKKLSILAVSNTTYRIARTSPFIGFNKGNIFTQKSIDGYFELPRHIETLDEQNISSESKALDVANISGMLNEISGEREIDLTMRGRAYSGNFSFTLPEIAGSQRDVTYDVSGVQIEVDGGYEGHNGIYLIEGKMGICTSINLRQLLYPYINYSNLFRKNIVANLFVYEEPGRFHFIPFTYTSAGRPTMDFGRHVLYHLRQRAEISLSELMQTRVNPELTGHGAPFPQADRFVRLVEVFLKVRELDCADKESIFEDQDVTPRQWDYYLNALKWLGYVILDEERACYKLTAEGLEVASMNEQQRLFHMACRAFSNEIFNAFLHSDNPHIPSGARTRNRLAAESTFDRRMQTVKAWKWYIFNFFENLEATR
jgi:hypothetical protein